MHVGSIFCDLTKASDCINHEILLTKLHFHGTQGAAEDWFKSYLTNRNHLMQLKIVSQTGEH
jgi:hypothetical protein